jgi:hypothetical protein
MQTAKVAVIFMTIRSCSGGVLPSTSSTAFNFDLRTGKMLQLEDFITHVPSLQKVVNRKWSKMDWDSDRVTADCNFPGLPRNFELKHDGIFFWSQPLEYGYSESIGSHFAMSYEELGALVRKDKIF